MERDSLDSVSLLKSLWKPDSLFCAKVPIVDTLLWDKNRSSNIMWLFSDSKGHVKRKKESNCTVSKIVKKFLGEILSGDQLTYYEINKPTPEFAYVAYFFCDGRLRLIDRTKFLKTISRSLGKYEAIQEIKNSNSSLYILYLNIKEAGTIYRCYREYSTKERSTIHAAYIVNRLKQISEEIVKSVERNINERIKEAELIFVEDRLRNIFFMGSYFCKLKSTVKLSQLSTDRKLSESIRKRNDSVSFVPRRLMTRTASSIAKLRVPSVQSEAESSTLYFKRTKRKECAGDFCKFVITSNLDRNSEEEDYDQILKILRDAVKERESFLKLHIANEFILRKKDMLRHAVIRHEIPYRLIALGKVSMERSELDLENNTNTIDLRTILLPFINNDEVMLDTDRDKLRNSAMKAPYHFYNSVKVCDRCYIIYYMMQHFCKETRRYSQTSMKSQPRSQSITVIRDSCNESPSRGINRAASGGSNMIGNANKQYAQTALGLINKNNIDDLLVDMNHALLDSELNESAVKKQFLKLCQSKTEGFKLKLKEQQEKLKYEIKPKLGSKASDSAPSSQPAMNKFIPVPIIQLTDRNPAKGSWKKFIEMTRSKQTSVESKVKSSNRFIIIQ